jgi:transcriptional regulator with XRE-family HTH domain
MSAADRGGSPRAKPGGSVDLPAQLKRLRTDRGLSLSQVAKGTGISSSFLSLVEHGKSDIAVGRLARLADFYAVELADLIMTAQPARDPVQLLRADESTMLHSGAEGVNIYDLAAGVRGTLIPLLSLFEPFAIVRIEAPSGREGILFALEGAFEIRLAGGGPVRLEEGQGARYRADAPYEVKNASPARSRLLAIAVRREPVPPDPIGRANTGRQPQNLRDL